MNGLQFNEMLTKLRRGDVIQYHVGLLMRDRCFNVDVDSAARAAWQAYKDGRVVLVQRRLDAGNCQYFAHVVRVVPKQVKG